jgi:tetratricopeptide (TPR) repeat protein
VDTQHYKAFISYSHRDESWARWLQRALETYRVPKRLVGQQGAFGPIPERLRPVFRDREDLSSSADLTAQLKENLANSDTLVVICSPTAAGSPWVNREIRYFSELGRGDRILALIVGGDPHSGDDKQDCFPVSILQTPEGARREPLAADVRRYADGKHLSKLKIIAGVLGIGLDELRQRDAQRRNRNRFVYGAAALIVVSFIGWLMYSVATTRAAAEVQRANTEDLLSFMQGDLEQLDPIEGLERISPGDEGQARLRSQLGLIEMDRDSLLKNALDWRQDGIDLKWNGELEAAMEQFVNSRAALIELHQQEGTTAQTLFELGQTEYYVGEVYIQMGELDLAQQYWSHYGVLTRRLLNSEPKNPRYVMELSYTLMNLGALEQQRPEIDVSKSLKLIQAAVQYNHMALLLDRGNTEFKESLMNELAWLADAWLEQCALGNALKTRQESLDLRRERLGENPEETNQQFELARTLTGLASVQQQIGLTDQAIDSFEEAVEVLQRLQRAEPDNAAIEWEALYREARLARLLMARGGLERAFQIIDPMATRIWELGDIEVHADYLRAVQAAVFQLDHAKILQAVGKNEQGVRLLDTAIDQLSRLVESKPGFRASLEGLATASFDYWEQHGEHPPGTVDDLLEGYLDRPESVANCNDAALAARLALTDGNYRLADRYTGYVLEKGYSEPGFLTFCRKYQLCDLP